MGKQLQASGYKPPAKARKPLHVMLLSEMLIKKFTIFGGNSHREIHQSLIFIPHPHPTLSTLT
jgi:hypothetical protein